MRRETIDLEREAEQIRDGQIAEIEETQDDLVAKLNEEYEDFSEVPTSKRQAFDELEARKNDLEGEAQALERAAEQWGDGVFVVQELTTGQLATIQDRVSEKSFDFDLDTGDAEGTPKSGYGMVETLGQAIVEAPDGAPTRSNPHGPGEVPDPAEYPHQVGLFLFEKVNEFNAMGETDLGNSSLRERMKKSDS